MSPYEESHMNGTAISPCCDDVLLDHQHLDDDELTSLAGRQAAYHFSAQTTVTKQPRQRNPKRDTNPEKESSKPSFLEFFAGSGLVAQGLKPYFNAIWANDICPKKAAVYTANHNQKHFQLGSIVDVCGQTLPDAALSWASFPCQDLSLAGLNGGIHAERSGLVWQWLRIMDEMPKRTPILVAENVTGLLSSHDGIHYRALHHALRERGYLVGALVLDAVNWVPHSRPRVFIVALQEDIPVPVSLTSASPTWAHPGFLVNAVKHLEGFTFWRMPAPPERVHTLSDLIEWDAPTDDTLAKQKKLHLISEPHRTRLEKCPHIVAAGYKRTRKGSQVLELRFDGIAGCLRTAEGGSSRQIVILKRGNDYETRLLTVRETARLMGAPDNYLIPGSYNEGYSAMGDAVAMPVASYLGQHLLQPLHSAIHA